MDISIPYNRTVEAQVCHRLALTFLGTPNQVKHRCRASLIL